MIISKWKSNNNSDKDSMFLIYKNNARDINYFTKKFTKFWCDEWLLVNKKVILMVGLDENQ